MCHLFARQHDICGPQFECNLSFTKDGSVRSTCVHRGFADTLVVNNCIAVSYEMVVCSAVELG